jgi:hypothetical protein
LIAVATTPSVLVKRAFVPGLLTVVPTLTGIVHRARLVKHATKNPGVRMCVPFLAILEPDTHVFAQIVSVRGAALAMATIHHVVVPVFVTTNLQHLVICLRIAHGARPLAPKDT